MTADLHRFEAHATIKPGEHELTLAGECVQLVRVVLSDDGPVIADGGDGPQVRRVGFPSYLGRFGRSGTIKTYRTGF